ncbi:hypothetical protein C6P40_005363, partial [Pichia californica]
MSKHIFMAKEPIGFFSQQLGNENVIGRHDLKTQVNVFTNYLTLNTANDILAKHIDTKSMELYHIQDLLRDLSIDEDEDNDVIEDAPIDVNDPEQVQDAIISEQEKMKEFIATHLQYSW